MEKRQETTEVLTPNQKLFDEKYRNLIGDVLSVVEAVVPESPNDRQWLNVRKMLNREFYDARDEFLKKFVK